MKIKTIKASILGLILIGVSIYVILTSNDYNTTFISGLIFSGCALLFIPDKFIGKIEKAFLGKEIKLPFQNEHEEKQ